MNKNIFAGLVILAVAGCGTAAPAASTPESVWACPTCSCPCLPSRSCGGYAWAATPSKRSRPR
jgi:hypothetical protein